MKGDSTNVRHQTRQRKEILRIHGSLEYLVNGETRRPAGDTGIYLSIDDGRRDRMNETLRNIAVTANNSVANHSMISNHKVKVCNPVINRMASSRTANRTKSNLTANSMASNIMSNSTPSNAPSSIPTNNRRRNASPPLRLNKLHQLLVLDNTSAGAGARGSVGGGVWSAVKFISKTENVI